MLERRKEQRWPAYLGGRIICGRGEPGAECLIRSTSSSGARLAVRDAERVPDEFTLEIPARKTEVRVTARWRLRDMIGIEVVTDRAGNAPVDIMLARRVRELQQQNRRLRRRISDLTETLD